MIKPTLRSISSSEESHVPKFYFSEYVKGETYHNDDYRIDFVTDGEELYVCTVDTLTTTMDNLSDQSGMLKLVSKGEPGRDGVKGKQGLPGHAPNITAKFEGDQLSIYADGRRIATTKGLTGPAGRPKKINNTIIGERSSDDSIPLSVDLDELRADDYAPILLRTNSDNTKRDDEVSGPANFIQWKYEGQEEGTNLISISELMNLALAGVSIGFNEDDGKYHLGHRQVIRASYDSSKEGPEIISDVELGEVLFDAGAIPTIGEGDSVSPEEFEERIQELLEMIPSLDGYATEEGVNNQGFLKFHQPLKTINNQSLIGSGNITIESGGGSGTVTGVSVNSGTVYYPDPVTGIVNISIANNPIIDLRIQNQYLQKKSVNDTSGVTVGLVGGGSGGGSGMTEEEVKTLLGEVLEGLRDQDIPEYAQTVGDNYFVRINDINTILSNYYTKAQVYTKGEVDAMITGGTVTTYRTFMIFKRSASNTLETLPTAAITGNVSTGVLDIPTTGSNGGTEHPENATTSTPYLGTAYATFESLHGERVGNGDGPFCLTGEEGKDGEDGKGVEFIYHRGAIAPTVDKTKAFKTGETTKTNVSASWGNTAESTDWLPGDGTTVSSSNIGHGTDNPMGVDDESADTKTEGACVRHSYYDSSIGETVGENFSAPFIWSMGGEDGVDGDGVEYIFFVTGDDGVIRNTTTGKATLKPTYYMTLIPQPGDNVDNWDNVHYQINDGCPDGTIRGGYQMPDYNWTDNPSDVDSNQPFEFVCIRKYDGITGKGGPFSEPKLGGYYGTTTVQTTVYGSTNYRPYTCYAFYRTNNDISNLTVKYDFRSMDNSYDLNTTFNELTAEQQIQFYNDPLSYAITVNSNNVDQHIVWSDTIPTGDQQLGMITAHIGDEDQISDTGGTSPVQGGDQAGINVEYSADEEKGALVYNNPSLGNNNHLTFNDYSGSDEEREALGEADVRQNYGVGSDTVEDPIYMATTYLKSNGVWTDGTISKIKGKNGSDGIDGSDGADGTNGLNGNKYEYVYYRNNGGTPLINKSYGTYSPESSQQRTRAEVVPTDEDFFPAVDDVQSLNGGSGIYGTDHPQGVGEGFTHEWMAFRERPYGASTFESFSDPILGSKFGETGKDGDGIEYVFFALTDSERTILQNDSSYTILDESTLDSKGRNRTQSEYLPKLKSGITRNNNRVEADDDNPGPTEEYPNVYASMRKYNGTTKTGGSFSPLKLWLIQPEEATVHFALLDVSNDSIPILVDEDNIVISTQRNDFNTEYLVLRDENGEGLVPQTIKINNQVFVVIKADGINHDFYTINLTNDITLTPYHVIWNEADLERGIQFYVSFSQNYILSDPISIPITVTSGDYSGYGYLKLIPTTQENYVSGNTYFVSLSPIRTTGRGTHDYNKETFDLSTSGNDISKLAKYKFWYQNDNGSNKVITLDSAKQTEIIARNGQETSYFYVFDVNGNYLYRCNGYGDFCTYYYNNAQACFAIQYSTVDLLDNVQGMYTRWNCTFGVVLKNLYANSYYPIDEFTCSVGVTSVSDEATISIVYPGAAGRGIQGITTSYISIANNHFEAAKESGDTETIISKAFYDDDIGDGGAISSDYSPELTDILNDILEDSPNYGESYAVSEDPRTAGTYTIKRTTITYTSGAPLVSYEVIDHVDDVSYLKGVFGEDVDHQNGAILRNFLGVSSTTDSGNNVKAFLNANPSIAKQGQSNTLMIAAGVPSTSGQTLDTRANNAKFRVYEDGSMHATSGSIAGFEIVDNKLIARKEDSEYTVNTLPYIKFDTTDSGMTNNEQLELGMYNTEGVDPEIRTKIILSRSGSSGDDEFEQTVAITPEGGIRMSYTDNNTMDSNSNVSYIVTLDPYYGISYSENGTLSSTISTSTSRISGAELFRKLNSIS